MNLVLWIAAGLLAVVALVGGITKAFVAAFVARGRFGLEPFTG